MCMIVLKNEVMYLCISMRTYVCVFYIVVFKWCACLWCGVHILWLSNGVPEVHCNLRGRIKLFSNYCGLIIFIYFRSSPERYLHCKELCINIHSKRWSLKTYDYTIEMVFSLCGFRLVPNDLGWLSRVNSLAWTI